MTCHAVPAAHNIDGWVPGCDQLLKALQEQPAVAVICGWKTFGCRHVGYIDTHVSRFESLEGSFV
jgi:hypothetical protein